MAEKLVSTRVLRDRIAGLRDEVKDQRRMRAESDPFFRHAEWLLAEWEQALRDAEREYVGTAEATRLTGWNEATLRKYGRAVVAGEPVPAAWAGLLVSRTDDGMAFCVASIPVKGQAAA